MIDSGEKREVEDGGGGGKWKMVEGVGGGRWWRGWEVE